jgi:hypothetical protein
MSNRLLQRVTWERASNTHEPLLVELSRAYYHKTVNSIEDLLDQGAITAAESIEYAVGYFFTIWD